jgi:hypothetical protein
VVVLLVVGLVLSALVGGRRHGARVVVTSGGGADVAARRLQEWGSESRPEDEPLRNPRESSSPGASTSDAGRHRRGDDRVRGMFAAGADAGILAAHSWLSVDDSVFQAASQAAHAPIDNLLDLTSVAHLDSWAEASAGVQHQLAGHVGEFIARDHLEAAGLSTHMAELSNQQGWDATIGNLHVNFKDYADYHSPGIAEHFAANPDVPVVMPADAAHLPADALHITPSGHLDPSDLAGHHVFVLDGWHHADAAKAMQSAYEQIDPGIALHHAAELAASGNLVDAAGAIDLGFPVVTSLMSGYREGKLVISGDTDLLRAATNIGLDVGGVVGGGSIGHLIGSGIGVVLGGPPGAIVGGILGGVAGAIGGKVAAGAVRGQPLRDAAARYKDAHEELVATGKEAEALTGSTWTATSKTIGAEYEQSVRELVSLYDDFAAAQRSHAEEASTFSAADAERVFGRARGGVDTAAALPDAPRRWLALPGIRQLSGAAAVRQLRRDLDRWDQSCADALTDEPERDRVLDLLAAVPGGDAEIERFVARGAEARTTAYRAIAAASAQTQTAAIGLRTAAQERLEDGWTQLQAEVQERLEATRERLTKAEAKLQKELRAAGKHTGHTDNESTHGGRTADGQQYP